jgi:hypothetical protein
MFEHLPGLHLEEIEDELKKQLSAGTLIGQMPVQPDDYRRLVQVVRSTLAGEKARLHDVPPRVWLVTMAFCARYEESICDEGFWSSFLRTIGLNNDPPTQTKCGQRWEDACHLFGLPIDVIPGPYRYVRSILRHAIVPQTCVPPLARLLAGIGDEPGWGLIVNLSSRELENLLLESPLVAPTLKRFLQRDEFRPMAVRLVKELCELAEEWQQGRLSSDDVKELSSGDPILDKLWDGLQKELAQPRTAPSSAGDVFAEPRWRWDISGQQLGLYVPPQRLRRHASAYQVGNRRFPVQVHLADSRWVVEEAWITDLPFSEMGERLTVRLLDAGETTMRPWQIAKPTGSVMFFRPDASGMFGTFTPCYGGIASGAWVIAYRRGVELTSNGAPLEPLFRYFAPTPLYDYEAGWFEVKADVTVRVGHGEASAEETIRVIESASRRLRFSQAKPLNVGATAGAPVYADCVPDLIVPAESREEVTGLRLWLKPLEATQPCGTLTPRVADLLAQKVALWDEVKRELTVCLSKLLPASIAGRFEVTLRRGWQTTRYGAEEFLLAPGLEVEMQEDKLWTLEEPPMAVVTAPGAVKIESPNAERQAIEDARYRLCWKGTASEFNCVAVYNGFRLPLSWSPHILRAAVATHDETTNTWLEKPLTVSRTDLTFERELRVEGYPEASYQLRVGEQVLQNGQFPASGVLTSPLAQFSDAIAAQSGQKIEAVISVMGQELALFHVYNAPIIDGFALTVRGRQLRVTGRPLGWRDGYYELVLHDRLRPWREPLRLPSIPPVKLEKGTIVSLPEGWRVGFYDVEVFLATDGDSTPVLDKAERKYRLRAVQFGKERSFRSLLKEATQQAEPALAVAVLTHLRESGDLPEAGSVLPNLSSTQAWQYASTAPKVLPLAVRALIRSDNLTAASGDSLTSFFTRLVQECLPHGLRSTLCRELLHSTPERARQVMQTLFDRGVNFASITGEELRSLLVSSKENSSVLWELWQPLGAFYELPVLENGDSERHWSEYLGLGDLYLARGMQVRLSDSVNRFDVTITDINDESGEVTAEEPSPAPGRNLFSQNLLKTHWRVQSGSAHCAEVWFTFQEGSEERFAFRCSNCGQVCLNPRVRYCGCGTKQTLQLVTPEQPLLMWLTRLRGETVRWYERGNRGLIGILAGAAEGYCESVERLARVRDYIGFLTSEHVPLLHPRSHLRAFAVCCHQYIASEDEALRQSLRRLVVLEEWEQWRKIAGALLESSTLGQHLSPCGIAILQQGFRCYEQPPFGWPGESLSRLDYAVLALATLNRLAARDTEAVAAVMRKAKLTPERLVRGSADAFRGCRLLFERALCWVEALFAWYAA